MKGMDIDLDYLKRFCKEDRARMERYVNMYIQGSPALFQDLLAKVEAGDAEGLAVAAHSLRPQVNYMGAQRVFDLLTAIESEARTKGTTACGSKVQECIAFNGSVVTELQDWLAAGRSAQIG